MTNETAENTSEITDIETFDGTRYNSYWLLEKHGVVSNDTGANVYLTQDAYLDNSADNEATYFANGVDMAGNLYMIEWEILEGHDLDCDQSDACDWYNPISVRLIETND